MDESGVRLRLGGLLGQYTYVSISPGVGEVEGNEASGALMAGYEWVTQNATFAIYLGGEFQNRRLNKVDPSNSVV
ncbi:MAG: cellulose biosynthesis protein BcsS, partial [Alphaproteobacteria bacterium]|nr:cellulose biosynthesis protein BcsS [Alphaproteobacteria bacterium]